MMKEWLNLVDRDVFWIWKKHLTYFCYFILFVLSLRDFLNSLPTMSNYLDSADTDDEGDKKVTEKKTFTETEIVQAKESAVALKTLGNEAFSAQNFEEAVEKYTLALNALKAVSLPKDPIILLNRSAS